MIARAALSLSLLAGIAEPMQEQEEERSLCIYALDDLLGLDRGAKEGGDPAWPEPRTDASKLLGLLVQDVIGRAEGVQMLPGALALARGTQAEQNSVRELLDHLRSAKSPLVQAEVRVLQSSELLDRWLLGSGMSLPISPLDPATAFECELELTRKLLQHLEELGGSVLTAPRLLSLPLQASRACVQRDIPCLVRYEERIVTGGHRVTVPVIEELHAGLTLDLRCVFGLPDANGSRTAALDLDAEWVDVEEPVAEEQTARGFVHVPVVTRQKFSMQTLLHAQHDLLVAGPATVERKDGDATRQLLLLSLVPVEREGAPNDGGR